MGNIIHLLPDSVADKIAAGEVIGRPAAAVKELLENAIDAGANNIHLVLKQAGKELIKVVDNGKGMSPMDARMCFSRHATSKISEAEDLFQLSTKGFRGEALASIAAVAQVELRTRPTDDELGTYIRIEGSEVIEQEPCQCVPGTHFSIKNLFYNVPARRRFLKSEQVEMRHIIEEFQRIVLAHPNIAFTLTHNEKEVYHLNQGNLKQRIIAIMGKKYLTELLVVEEDTTSLSIKGFVGKPEVARKTRGQQFFFVNDRFIKHHYLQHAVKSCYEGIMHDDLMPFFVLFLDIDPSRIDVNVHPSKQEIKFEDEQLVYKLLKSVVQRALGSHNVTPAIDFDQEAILDGGAWIANINKSNKEAYNPFTNGGSHQERVFKMFQNDFQSQKPVSDDWKQALQTEQLSNKENETVGTQSAITIASSGASNEHIDDDSKSMFSEHKHETNAIQIHYQYIIYQTASGLMLVDRKAALERILFERYKAQFEQAQPSAPQRQMFPQILRLPANESHILRNILSDIRMLGYLIEEKEANQFSIEGVPADMPINDHSQVIETLLEQYKLSSNEPEQDYRTQFFKTLARQNALKADKDLSLEEMHSLVDKLFGCDMSYISPSGQATYTRLTLNEIASLLKR